MLVGDLDLSGKGFTKTLGKLTGEFDGFVSKISKFGSIAAGLASPLAGLQGISGFISGLGKVLELSEHLHELHLSTGQSVHDLVILRQAFELGGLGADGMGKFLFKLQTAASGVNEAGNSTAKSLSRLGLTSASLKQMGGLQQIEAISKGLAGIANQSDRASIVLDLFGKKAGHKAMQLLMDPEAFAKARQQAEPLAKLMDENDEKFHKLSDAMKGLSLHSDEFFGGALSEMAKDGTDLFDKLGNVDFTGIGEMVGTLADMFIKLAKAVASLAPLINRFSAAMDKRFGHHTESLALSVPQAARAAHHAAAVTSLQRVGGGGRGGMISHDPILEEQRRSNMWLQKIANNIGKGSPAPVHHPIPV